MGHITRRQFLGGLGLSSVVGSGMTGCLTHRGGRAPDSITIAYIPIYPNMQHYVMQKEGYYDDLPVDVTVERFSSGPSVVTAFVSGDIDVALFGITPAMVLSDKGTAGGVLAANSINGFKLMATTDVADLYKREGTAAFEQFEASNGRKIRFGAPPDGSVPDIVLRYWFERDLGIGELESVITKSNIPPAKAVQTIFSGDIDATIIQEPFATIIGRDPRFRELAWSGEILMDHPVTVLFGNRRVIEAPEIAQSLVEQHNNATEFTTNSPNTAAVDAASIIGSGVNEQLASTAMKSRAADFLSNPHMITTQAATMAEFVADVGNTDEPVSTEDLFAFEAYDALH